MSEGRRSAEKPLVPGCAAMLETERAGAGGGAGGGVGVGSGGGESCSLLEISVENRASRQQAQNTDILNLPSDRVADSEQRQF